MQAPASLPDKPKNRLPREAYVSEDWFQVEQAQIFSRCWTFAGATMDFPEPGNFRTIKAGANSVIVIKGADGELRGFHNLCRHRGTELLEGCGNAGKTIVCPYHNWVYNLDGALRGVPAQRECFPDLDKKSNALFGAAVGVFHNLVFVNPDPDADFDKWLSGLDQVPWPHDLTSTELQENPDNVVYEIDCNWKVFFENAIDGYHLAYLHKDTLGGPTHDKNLWEVFGQNMIWWSTEREGVKHRIPQFVENSAKGSGLKTVKNAETPGYGGVYMLFPTTILTPNPWGFSISTMEPISANRMRLRVRNWSPKGWFTYTHRASEIPGYDAETGLIKSSHWTKHPLETGDFQTEDVWVCEKMQKSMQSPRFEVGALAIGAGGEAAIDFFQQTVLGLMPKQ
ncbi:aromatic ring-hydroxylating dioxygenase subunit alpha [Ruegeria conchae]|uniref:aromatic ring-hydroxylating oxygenase subunit alpha n=1 Tax=Ruegeria conchae TaxID=981384 RepID=UPI0029C77CC7|nr:aromatic ring-hydroxylating dioxygenase subunit alpha [Ruegeria conchae]